MVLTKLAYIYTISDIFSIDMYYIYTSILVLNLISVSHSAHAIHCNPMSSLINLKIYQNNHTVYNNNSLKIQQLPP